MKKFTSSNLDTVRTDLEKAIAAVEAKHGITLGLGKISYERDGSAFHLKLSANIGTKAEASKLQWDKWCELYDLKKSDFGKAVTLQGKKFTVTGIKPNSPKNTIEITDIDGKTYGCGVGAIK